MRPPVADHGYPTYAFTGQVALVTSASSDRGHATARAFAEAVAAVVLADINEDTLRTAADESLEGQAESVGVAVGVVAADRTGLF